MFPLRSGVPLAEQFHSVLGKEDKSGEGMVVLTHPPLRWLFRRKTTTFV
jgi:hypothetical protein